jgi:hypothetical protein
MLSLPSGSRTVQVQIIDTTSQLDNIPTSAFFGDSIQGFDTFDGPCYSFLITHTGDNGQERHIIWDLGVRKDWTNLVPSVVENVSKWGENFKLEVQKDVAEVLGENGVNLKDIEAIIWRYVIQSVV